MQVCYQSGGTDSQRKRDATAVCRPARQHQGCLWSWQVPSVCRCNLTPNWFHIIEIYIPEIHEEAGAFTVADIDTAFALVMPTQDQYESYDIRADIKKFKDIGDASRIAMILQVISSM